MRAISDYVSQRIKYFNISLFEILEFLALNLEQTPVKSCLAI